MDIQAKQLCARFGQMKLSRSIHEAHWGECYKYGAPERQQSFIGDNPKSQREKERADLVDSTAAEAIQLLVSMIMSGVTPANSIWFQAAPDGVDDISQLTDGERWLETVCQFMWRNIHAANFDSEAFETITDVTVAGWGVLYTDIDHKEGGGYVFESWPIGSCWIGSSRPNGVVDIIYREHEMTAEAMVNAYGEDKCASDVVNAARTEPERRFKLLHVIQPRKTKGAGQLNTDMAFASYHVDLNHQIILKESGYQEFPCSIPRLRRLPNSVYGNGQMSVALPDAKTCNELVRQTLRAADMQICGMWIASDDGVLNPHTIKVGPRKVVVANSVESMKRLDDGVNFQIAEYLLNNLQNGIRKKLMADQLPPIGTQQMTATEINTRVEIIRQQLGPLYGRLQSEFLMPLLDRCFGLALRSGVLPPPPRELWGANLSFKFISPLARAQRLDEVIATEQFVVALTQFAEVDKSVLDVVDLDAAANVVARGRGVPQSILRTDEEVDQLRTARQKAMEEEKQKAMQQQMAQQMGGVIADGAKAAVTQDPSLITGMASEVMQ
ncbi:head-tail connector protein [Acinetobacter baumannii]|uniref:portal protein n=1 Tax=Acinetobacter baumannii TaxID=470 RepID=UPI00189B05A2|nr:portal protein [Acinetobacter baumannii]MBF6687453.1 phage head-tail adapter protein [Acinetobacter baumannii]MBF6846179.1 phage head-tail adapter protein [Acinetobacter baumannii]MBF6916473.1 head-tail connector protein [Acinetobacter baumannii]MBF6969296.1 head-tail connector protein [Acinetobacter baumannii]